MPVPIVCLNYRLVFSADVFATKSNLTNCTFRRGALDAMIQTSFDLEDAQPGSHLLGHAEEGRERGDGVHYFLLLLADIYKTYPELWQNEELK